uniref:Autophagy_act_C domain-containing protein n=1 Tax=Caenorhabditis japonica TaxID=281687 RepID=A0A8R1IPW7_CAEJA
MEYDEKLEKIINETESEYQTGEEDGWVDTHHYDKGKEHNAQAVDLGSTAPSSAPIDDDDEEALDLDDLVESGGLDDEDPNRFVAARETDASGEVEKVRTYDLHICYDKYYQVGTMSWLWDASKLGHSKTVNFSAK